MWSETMTHPDLFERYTNGLSVFLGMTMLLDALIVVGRIAAQAIWGV
jgi:hypothetical protein